MSDFRVHCLPTEASPAEIRLSSEESHHLIVVNRCQRGDTVIAFDGAGREWLTECSVPHKSAAVLRVREALPPRRRAFSLTLAQALPKGSTMDDIVRQATEVGVARIVPLLSERTQVHFEGDRAEKKVEKWRTTAIEAAKQCGNPWLPEIAPVQTLASYLASTSRDALNLIASLHPGARSFAETLASARPLPASASWLIGPEGDFSPAEMEAATVAGFLPVTLGPLVLRSDTAALYALSILSNALQER